MLSHTDRLGVPCGEVASLYLEMQACKFASFALAGEVLATPV